MVMIFGKGRELSIVYDISSLTEQDKTGGVLFEELPEVEQREGFCPILVFENEELYWEYEEIIEEEIEE